MNRSEQTPISDELLSAYIDGAVTNQEKATVEAATSADPSLAWEVESLRRTVELVQALPPIVLPRSFALREDQVADVLAERRAKSVAANAPAAARSPRQQSAAPSRQNFWSEFLAFFNSGNLLLRNASAVAGILFVVVLVTAPGLTQSSSSMPVSVQSQAELFASPGSLSEPAPAAAQESADTSAEVSPDMSPDMSANTQNEESAPAAAEAAAEVAALPAAQSAAPMAEMAAAPPAPAGADTGVASTTSTAMRAEPDNRDTSAARMMPEARGGGAESGPPLFQAAPAALAPIGGEATLGDIPDQGQIRRPIDTGIGAAPVAESAAEVSAAEVSVAGASEAEVPETEVPVAERLAEAAADIPAAEESPPAMAAKSAPAEVSDESAAQESQPSLASVESESTPIPAAPGLPWAYWGWLQTFAGGLALLLGAFWLYTTRRV